jgi:predicted enzyme related to lactoylglutathione lyase
MITDVAFTVYPVTDIARSRAFYEGALGLVPAETFGDAWIEYSAGSATFAITNNFGFTGPSTCVAFEVDNLETQVASLKAAGVAIDGGINDFPTCRMVLVNDPDGSTVCLHQKKKS